MRCFRMNPSGEDPAKLLSEDEHWTAPWGGSDDGAPCDKCDGSGTTRYECWSCVLTGVNASCPACGGKVRWNDECPVCRGTGAIDGKARHGVSVYPTLEGLYHYMQATEADLDGCMVVEIEAERADDVDFDADQGAMLMIPTAVCGCRGVESDLLEDVQRRSTGQHAG